MENSVTFCVLKVLVLMYNDTLNSSLQKELILWWLYTPRTLSEITGGEMQHMSQIILL
jgi:hypothetical protein